LKEKRVGFGYDVHRFIGGRPLFLGGVRIEFKKGLIGHSDADVVLHALIDALLGAAGLGDIGMHFPPEDPSFKDISSLLLLEKTAALLEKEGFGVVNVDLTIVCEAPRLRGFIPAMEKNIARVLGCEVSRINVKATTEEGLGFTGRGEGIAAYGVALIEK
jgi:2-C-methyl-D-erythritol 2,4-cyclodiphosphate synthase